VETPENQCRRSIYFRAIAAWSNAGRRRRRLEIASLIAGRVLLRARFSLADVDLHEIGIRCPKCGHDIKQTIGWLKAETRMVGRQPVISATLDLAICASRRDQQMTSRTSRSGRARSGIDGSRAGYLQVQFSPLQASRGRQ
jgi:hypothetical protein